MRLSISTAKLNLHRKEKAGAAISLSAESLRLNPQRSEGFSVGFFIFTKLNSEMQTCHDIISTAIL